MWVCAIASLSEAIIELSLASEVLKYWKKKTQNNLLIF